MVTMAQISSSATTEGTGSTEEPATTHSTAATKPQTPPAVPTITPPTVPTLTSSPQTGVMTPLSRALDAAQSWQRLPQLPRCPISPSTSSVTPPVLRLVTATATL